MHRFKIIVLLFLAAASANAQLYITNGIVIRPIDRTEIGVTQIRLNELVVETTNEVPTATLYVGAGGTSLVQIAGLTVEDVLAAISLSDISGSVTDAQIPNSFTLGSPLIAPGYPWFKGIDDGDWLFYYGDVSGAGNSTHLLIDDSLRMAAVNSGATGNNIAFRVDTGAGSSRMTVQGDGDVGVVGTVTATAFAGDGTELTGIPSPWAGSQGATATHTGDVSVVNGNVTATALSLSGTNTLTYTTPAASGIAAKLVAENYTIPAFGQVLAVGTGSGSPPTARVMSMFDQRSGAHQPTLAVFSPAESDAIGFSWEGQNGTAYVKTLGSEIAFRYDTTDMGTFSSSGLDVAGTITGQFVTQSEVHSAGDTLTTSECYRNVHYVTGAYQLDLPSVAAGMQITVICTAATVVSVNPSGSEVFNLNGTTLTAGNEADSSGLAGSIAVFTYYSSGVWFVSAPGWVDGGSS